jgi:hypothetical protein
MNGHRVASVVAVLLGASLAPGCSTTSTSFGDTEGGSGPYDAATAGDAKGGTDAANAGDTRASGGDDASDATAAADAGNAGDAGGPEADAGCGEFTGDTNFTCSMDGNSRGECINGTPMIEACPRGCLREMSPQDSICMGPTDNWSCNGSYGTDRALNGDYDITSFGCWTDANNNIHTDQGDNCIPSCLNQAIAAGLCMQSDDGPTCEERVNWYTADGARFGCLQRLRVTNTLTGKAVIAVALDFGPSCSVESMVSKAVLDSSGRINLELFGGDQGVSDMSNVHVVEVDNSTPLGPVP